MDAKRAGCNPLDAKRAGCNPLDAKRAGCNPLDAKRTSRDFPTFSKQEPGTNDFGKNNMYISQTGKMDTKQNRGQYAYLVLI